MLTLVAPPGHQRRPAPGDLRAGATRVLDGRLLLVVPHQRPTERAAPEHAELVGAVAVDGAEPRAPGLELAAGSEHTEFVALRVGHHHVVLVGCLSDVDVPTTACEPDSACDPSAWAQNRASSSGRSEANDSDTR